LAPGARLAPERVPGLADADHGFYVREDAERLREALAGFAGGRVLVVVAAMPFKCPAAPYEAAFLIEDLLRRRGVDAKVDISTAEPQPLPVAGKVIGAQVAAMLADRGVGFAPERQLQSVDASAREAHFADGTERYDLLVAVPPHRAPQLVADSPLAGPQGWVPVDAATLRAGEHVHAIGDVTAIKLSNGMMLPKAGVFAHAQAEVVADNLAAAARGRSGHASFDGHGACFLETGAGRAGFASGDFYATPNPAVRMRKPARRWHWGKLLFERRWLARLR
jgi:sulfide:quinone oxidoreductase